VKTTVKLFVEGGGDSNLLRTKCRSAFSNFLQESGLTGIMPRIIASGPRQAAYDDYCTAINNGEKTVLLVDSEAAVIIPSDNSVNEEDPKTWKPWHHLKNRQGEDGVPADNWNKPAGASDEDCHLMVQIMESWFFADVEALKRYYGKEFNENSLPKRQDIENISKDDIFNILIKATNKTQKGKYSKGEHSFELLEIIDPHKVVNQSPWAKRFVDLLSDKMRRSK
jgi:hypothetical protein